MRTRRVDDQHLRMSILYLENLIANSNTRPAEKEIYLLRKPFIVFIHRHFVVHGLGCEVHLDTLGVLLLFSSRNTAFSFEEQDGFHTLIFCRDSEDDCAESLNGKIH